MSVCHQIIFREKKYMAVDYIYILCNLTLILFVFIFLKHVPCTKLYITSGNIYMRYHCVPGQSFASKVSAGCTDSTDRLKTIRRQSRAWHEQTEKSSASVSRIIRPAVHPMSAFVAEPQSSKWVIKSPPLHTIFSDLHLPSIFDLQDAFYA
jgi:hypothetical protein